MKPYYQDDYCTIYHGDCREVEVEAACVVTSPPYNVGIEYDEHDDQMAVDAYEQFMAETSGAIARAVVAPGRVWVNVAPTVAMDATPAGKHSGNTRTYRYPLMARWCVALEAAGLSQRDVVSWASQRGSGTAWGSWERPSAPNVRGDWEAILMHYSGEWPREAPPGQEGFQDRVGDWPGLTSNVWAVRPQFRTDHPAPFPVEIPSRCIRLSTWPGEVVFDPFMGSGATLEAAVSLGRRGVGCDVSERYCELAAKRLAQGAFDFGGAA